MSELKRLTPQQSRKVNALIKKTCCNCMGGNCILLDDGDECVCPQLISYSLLCRWDRAFHRPGVQAVTAAPESGKPLLVYFTQFINGHAESSSDSSVCIYGTAPDSGGWVALAGLSLGYWLLFNIALLLILTGVWFKLRRKEKSRRWVERLLPIPIAYGLGHLCVLGFRTASCSEWRDFQLILAVGVLFYCAMLLALSIFYNVKELRGIKREGENE